MARHKEFDIAEAIVKARDLFWLQGYEATSIQDLVDHLGISRSSLYDTFEDKHSLFLLTLDQYGESTCSQLTAMFDQLGFSSATIEHLFKSMVDHFLSDEPRRGCFMVNSTAELAHCDAEVASRSNGRRVKVEDLFYQAVANSQAAGELSTEQDPRALARFLFSAMQSIAVTVKTRPDRQVLEDIVNVTLSVLH